MINELLLYITINLYYSIYLCFLFKPILHSGCKQGFQIGDGLLHLCL